MGGEVSIGSVGSVTEINSVISGVVKMGIISGISENVSLVGWNVEMMSESVEMTEISV